ncbi:N-Acetyl-D-glucosamine ABC transport system [Rothia aeria]|uniref:N-Acetyl-D-glucosamine ABC transport system n=1 Tax=Rothia aeria TaxID=172042 RepID=A0A2Z5R047_9MICC|nr:N-Acetyl-D-glucosamine ABC transport system [Rothia aeria]
MGTTRRPPHGLEIAGLIPTYAGNTSVRSEWSVGIIPHPHVCGEHLIATFAVFACQGSSPRMRGTLSPPRCRFPTKGFIPTYAGNTPTGPCGLRCSGAHPHVCGEHMVNNIVGSKGSGSSPRMRGTHGKPVPLSGRVGLIPTYAGNTIRRLRFSPSRRAHPHVCGEHIMPVTFLPCWPGSSPRMRGTLLLGTT